MKLVIIISVAFLGMLTFMPIYCASTFILIRSLIQPIATLKIGLFGFPTTTFHSCIVVLAGVVTLFRVNSRVTPGNIKYIYIVLFLSALSLAQTNDVMLSVGSILRLATGAALYLLVYNGIKSKQDVFKYAKLIAFFSVPILGYGFYQYFTGNYLFSHDDGMGRISSLFGMSNAYGIYLTILMAFLFFLIINNVHRKFNVLLLFGVLSSQVLALNRGTWISLCLSILFIVPFYRQRIKFRWLFISIAIVSILFSSVIIDRVVALSDPSVYGVKHNSFEHRLEYWQALVPFITEKPLSGHGIGQSEYIAEHYFHMYSMPHNDYIRLALEIGIPGMLVYTFFFLSIFMDSIKRQKSDSLWGINFSTSFIAVYFIIISFAQNAYHSPINFPLLLSFFAMARKYNELPALSE